MKILNFSKNRITELHQENRILLCAMIFVCRRNTPAYNIFYILTTAIWFWFQVFSHAKAYFSVGGEHFFPEPVSYTYPADTIMPEARNVTVKLHHRTGRFLKLQLFFANKWMMISEISFESRKSEYSPLVIISTLTRDRFVRFYTNSCRFLPARHFTLSVQRGV